MCICACNRGVEPRNNNEMNNSPQHQDSPDTGRKQDFIYRVTFIDCPQTGDSRKEFFFHSLAAIYDTFTPEQVGCKVTRLWNIGVADGNSYHGRKCSITREPIMRKRHKHP